MNNRMNYVGTKIERVMFHRELSNKELANRVGISEEELSRYINGRSFPKDKMLKRIATALEVSPLALSEPRFSSQQRVMHLLFDLEYIVGCKPTKVKDSVYLKFTDNDMTRYMEEWYQEYIHFKTIFELSSSKKEQQEVWDSYENWKFNFEDHKPDAGKEKENLRKIIEELQELYDSLE